MMENAYPNFCWAFLMHENTEEITEMCLQKSTSSSPMIKPSNDSYKYFVINH